MKLPKSNESFKKNKKIKQKLSAKDHQVVYQMKKHEKTQDVKKIKFKKQQEFTNKIKDGVTNNQGYLLINMKLLDQIKKFLKKSIENINYNSNKFKKFNYCIDIYKNYENRFFI